jgi:hypothetical protein
VQKHNIFFYKNDKRKFQNVVKYFNECGDSNECHLYSFSSKLVELTFET